MTPEQQEILNKKLVEAINKDFTRIIENTGVTKCEIIADLIEEGAAPNVAGAGGITALMVAVQEKDLKLVTDLMKRGGKTWLKNEEGLTAFDIAAQQYHNELNVSKSRSIDTPAKSIFNNIVANLLIPSRGEDKRYYFYSLHNIKKANFSLHLYTPENLIDLAVANFDDQKFVESIVKNMESRKGSERYLDKLHKTIDDVKGMLALVNGEEEDTPPATVSSSDVITLKSKSLTLNSGKI